MYNLIPKNNSMIYYMEHKHLYLKYKTKYLNLKSQIGNGGNNTAMNSYQIYKNFIKSNKITALEFVELYDRIQDKSIKQRIIDEIKKNPNIDINQLKTLLNIQL